MPRTIRPPDLALYSMLSDPSMSPDGKKVAVSVRKADLKEDVYDSDVYVVGLDHGEAKRFTSGGKDANPRFSTDGKSILFTSRRGLKKEDKGNALYVIPDSGGEAKLVLRSEAGVENPRWSRDSKSIYYMSSVEKKEKDDVRVIRRLTFWFNGAGFIHNQRKHVFKVDVESGKASQVTRGAFDVGGFALSGDGRRLAYVAVTNDLKPYISDVFVVDLPRGKPRKLTRSDMEVGGLAWSPDGGMIALSADSLPSGFASHSHIWVVDVKTRKATQIEHVDRNKANSLNSDARPGGHAAGGLTWTKDGIYYVQADGASVHLYRAKPGADPRVVVGGERSVEGYDVSEGRVAFVSMDSTHLAELFLEGREKPLTAFNSSVYKEVRVLPPEKFTFKASDGERIEGWVVMPEGRGKKRPGVLYVHGGPKTAFGDSYMHEFQAFAGAGYAVVFMNPRGSDGYSEKFADIRGKYGTRDFEDLMEGLDWALKRYPGIDGANMAIAGGSYGGFMTNWAVGHTNRFKAAVTDRSIAFWTSFWGTSDIGPFFTEDQVGGDPWNAEEKLLNDSPGRYAPSVETPVMVVHSMEDYRCWMVEGLEFYTALKRLGKEAELVLFPGENHDLSRVGKPKHRVARLNHYIRWFDQHMKQ